MKKHLLFVFVMGLSFLLFSPVNSASAASTVTINHEYYTFDQPSFTSTKLHTFNSNYESKTVNVKQQQGDWLLIETSYGDEWFYNGDLYIDHDFVTYEDSSFTSNISDEFSGDRSVEVVDRKGDHWYLVFTHKGNKWVYYDADLGNLTIDHNFYTFEGPGFSYEKVKDAQGTAYYNPSTVNAVAQTGDWYQVITDKGNKWFYNGAMEIDHSFTVYDNPSFTSNEGDTYTQGATGAGALHVVDQSGNWYFVHTNKGNKWVYHDPNLGTITPPHNFYIFHGPSFNYSKVEDSGGGYAYYNANTTVEAVAQNGDWYQIYTDKGNKWYYDGELHIPHNFTTYKAASLLSESVATFESTDLKVIDKIGYWYKVYTNQGEDWTYYDGETGFSKPLTISDYTVTSRYGPRWGSFHHGIDLARSGTINVVAAAGGTVSKSYYSSSYGEVIIVRHSIKGEVHETLYAHMRSGTRKFSVGDTVNVGDVLGLMGNTGEGSTGQHLHFEIHDGTWNSSKSNSVDPENYINF
ncbi:M23 family metallopeptidase [Pseudalkalibacillus sp. SCS-8]|uniref:M23 family metallopeptidase n=1 Tax=Pseudalkalibacillus nanhaiensis TaxID=3115291 RepID=UPI0032DAC673